MINVQVESKKSSRRLFEVMIWYFKHETFFRLKFFWKLIENAKKTKIPEY